MASQTVRELITVWGFDVRDKPLENLSTQLKLLKRTAIGVGAAVAASATKIGLVLNEAGKMEQAEIAFTTILGSADAAKQKLDELFQFASKTPFTIPGILESSKQLLAVGIEADDLLPTLKALGDVSAGLSVPLSRLALNFGQIKTQGKLTGRELRDFAVAGVPLSEELARMLGKTTTEIQDMVSQGAIGFSEVEKAFIQMTSGSGRFADLMIKQSKSFFGILSNIKDFIQILAAEIGKEVLPQAKALALQFLTFVDANRELIKTKSVEFLKILANFIRDVITVLKGAMKVFKPFITLLGGAEHAIKLLTTAITILLAVQLAHFLGSLVIGFKTFVASVNLATASVFALDAAIALIPVLIGALVVLIGLIAEDIIAFFQGRNSVTGIIVQAFKDMVPKVKKALLNLFDTMAKTTSQFFNKWVDLFESNFPALFKFVKALTGFYIAAFKLILPVILFVFSSIIESVTGVIDILLRIPRGIKLILGLIATFIQDHKDFIVGVFKTMGRILITPFIDLKNTVMSVLKFIKNALESNLFADLISGPTAILNGLTKVFDFLSSGKRLGLLEKLSSFLDSLKQTIRLLPSTFLAVITSLNKAFSLSGTLDGMKAFLRSLIDIFKMQMGKLSGMVTNSFQAIRKAFSLSNTLERIKSSFTNIFSMLMKQAKQLPAKILDALSPISRIMLSQILPSVFNGMRAILENFKPIFDSLVGLIATLPSKIRSIFKLPAIAISSHVSEPDTLPDLSGVIEPFKSLPATINNFLKPIQNIITGISHHIIRIISRSTDAITSLLKMVQTVSRATFSRLTSMGVAVFESFFAMLNQWQKRTADLVSIFRDMKNQVVAIFKTAFTIIHNQINHIFKIAGSIVPFLINLLTTISQLATEVMTGLIRQVLSTIRLSVSGIFSAVTKALSELPEIFNSILDSILNIFSTPLKIIDGIVNKIRSISNLFSKETPVKDLFQSMGSKALKLAPTFQPFANIVTQKDNPSNEPLGLTAWPPSSQVKSSTAVNNIEVKAPISVQVPEGTPVSDIGIRIENGINTAIKDLLRTTLRANEPQVIF